MPLATTARPQHSPGPKIVFDGLVYWFTERFDEDAPCCMCKGPVDPDSVPLMLFREVPIHGRPRPATWLARFCERCSQALLCARVR